MINTEHGFSLFELLIVLVIISILANIAYPIYTHALIKTRRTEAKIALMDLANRIESYYLENNNSYLGASLNKLHIKAITDKKFYQLSLNSTNNTYLLSATATFSDPACYCFRLNQLGEKTNAGPSKQCW
jgi:type IV pilus assembly protein PilE